MNTLTKNEQIRLSSRLTREKHGKMVCKVVELKVVHNKLSKQKKYIINTLFNLEQQEIPHI